MGMDAWWEIKKTYCSRCIICVDTTDGTYNHAETLARRSIVHGTTTIGNIGFRCCKSPQKRNEHHYIWHDVDELKDGNLGIEDQYGKKQMVRWEDQFNPEITNHIIT